jgi:hypothetical protein
LSGLHNKYPDYFYKRGNLFGTYLSADAVDRARPEPDRPATRQRGDASTVRLNQFLRANMSIEQARRWARLVELRRRSGASMTLRSWWDIENYVKRLPEHIARKYLHELERRKAAGEALIRGSR